MQSDAEPGGERCSRSSALPPAAPAPVPAPQPARAGCWVWDGCAAGTGRAGLDRCFPPSWTIPVAGGGAPGQQHPSRGFQWGKQISEQRTLDVSPQSCVTLAEAPPCPSSPSVLPGRGRGCVQLPQGAALSPQPLPPPHPLGGSSISERSHFPFMLQSQKGFCLFFVVFPFSPPLLSL